MNPLKKLTSSERRLALLCGVLMLLGALGSVVPLLVMKPRSLLSISFLFIGPMFILNSLAWFIASAVLLQAGWRGTLSNRTPQSWMAWGWMIYLIVFGCLLLLLGRHLDKSGDNVRVGARAVVAETSGEEELRGIRNDLQLAGFVLLVYAAAVLMRHRAARAEWRTADTLLNVQAQLDEILETLETAPSVPAPRETGITSGT
jgi:hypothetical protein